MLGRTLGSVELLSADAARGAAHALIAVASAGTVSPVTAPTMQTFGPVFLADCAVRWKQATPVGHANNLRHHIQPAFRRRRVDAVTAREVCA